MGKIWDGVARWFQGKKTILGGGLIMAAGVAGVWFGKLDPTAALGVVGFGLSIAGASAKANRHQAELLAALQAVAQVSADAHSGKTQQAVNDAIDDAVSIGLKLVPSGTGGAAQ